MTALILLTVATTALVATYRFGFRPQRQARESARHRAEINGRRP